MRLRYIPLLLLIGLVQTGCGTYRQNIMFQTSPEQIARQTTQAESHYRIDVNDLLTLRVYTNQGEQIVDPNRESFHNGQPPSYTAGSPIQYLVDVNGEVRFPLIDPIKLAGLTLREAEGVLNEAYEAYYEDAWVVLQFTNKRVIVLGAPGGQVIPLQNENTRLAEVLALAKGVNADGRANNIRVLRSNEVYVADFSTFEGFQQGNIVIQPGDIVYVEPVRIPFTEALRDYSPAISIVTGIATLIFIITQIDQR